MVGVLDESGLNVGELFQFNGEKYKVLSGVNGLIVEPLKNRLVKRSHRGEGRNKQGSQLTLPRVLASFNKKHTSEEGVLML